MDVIYTESNPSHDLWVPTVVSWGFDLDVCPVGGEIEYRNIQIPTPVLGEKRWGLNIGYTMKRRFMRRFISPQKPVYRRPERKA